MSEWHLRIWLRACNGSTALYPPGERAIVYVAGPECTWRPKSGPFNARASTVRIVPFEHPDFTEVPPLPAESHTGVVEFAASQRAAA